MKSIWTIIIIAVILGGGIASAWGMERHAAITTGALWWVSIIVYALWNTGKRG